MKACVVNPTLGTFQSLEEADKVCTAVGAEWCAGIHDDECDGGASASKPFRLCAAKSLSPVKFKQNPKWVPTLGSKNDPLWTGVPQFLYDSCTLLKSEFTGEYQFADATGCSSKCGVGYGQSGKPGAITCSKKYCLDPKPSVTSAKVKKCPATKACGMSKARIPHQGS